MLQNNLSSHLRPFSVLTDTNFGHLMTNICFLQRHKHSEFANSVQNCCKFSFWRGEKAESANKCILFWLTKQFCKLSNTLCASWLRWIWTQHSPSILSLMHLFFNAPRILLFGDCLNFQLFNNWHIWPLEAAFAGVNKAVN